MSYFNQIPNVQQKEIGRDFLDRPIHKLVHVSAAEPHQESRRQDNLRRTHIERAVSAASTYAKPGYNHHEAVKRAAGQALIGYADFSNFTPLMMREYIPNDMSRDPAVKAKGNTVRQEISRALAAEHLRLRGQLPADPNAQHRKDMAASVVNLRRLDREQGHKVAHVMEASARGLLSANEERAIAKAPAAKVGEAMLKIADSRGVAEARHEPVSVRDSIRAAMASERIRQGISRDD